MSSPESSPAPSTLKRNPRKAAPRGKWSEEHLLTSDKSVLIDADLVRLLAKPEAWHILEEDEKREILALLPADIHPASELPSDDTDTKIPPLPDSFVRYSNNWRDGIRQFQLDLQNGRFDPAWLRQAEAARRKRENGDFDTFKEREFEKFWGQKQKTQMCVMSGESSKVKLTQLIEAGVFLVGDVWRFGYSWGRGPDRIVIEKEVKIHEISGQKLSFVVPNGQRVFLRTQPDTSEPKEESDRDESCDMKKPLKKEQCHGIIEAPESGAHKEESPMEAILEKEQPQDQSTELGDQEPKINQDDLLCDEKPTASSNPDMKYNLENESVQVVIVSPRHDLTVPEKALKRPTPLPAVEPPAKRKRGRPRKIRPPVHKAEPKADDMTTPDPKLELGRVSRVEVAISIDRSTLRQPEVLLRTAMPAPDPVTAPLSIIHNDDMDLGNSLGQSGPVSSPLSSERSISPTFSLAEPPNELTSKSFGLPSGRCIEPTEEPVQDHTQEAIDHTIEEFHEQINAQSIEQPMNQSGEKPVENDLEEELVQEPTGKSPEKFSEMSTEKATGEPTESPTDKPTPPASEVQNTGREPDEILVHDISSPMTLVRRILQIDGRMPDCRTANSWKEIRCIRKNQDMGSLFDVRQAWFLKQK